MTEVKTGVAQSVQVHALVTGAGIAVGFALIVVIAAGLAKLLSPKQNKDSDAG